MRTRMRASIAVVLALLVTDRLVLAVPGDEDTPCHELDVQSFDLQPGWNAVWLEVEPEPADSEAVFGDLPIRSVWTRVGSDWGAYFPAPRPQSILTTLSRVHAGRAYVIEIEGDVGVSWRVEGRRVFHNLHWTADEYNLFGFPVDEESPPTFAEFFGASTAHTSHPIFRLDASGALETVADPSTATMRRGEAYWVFSDGGSDYMGRLRARLRGRELDFGAELLERGLRIRNEGQTPLSAMVSLLASDPPVPLYCWQFDQDEKRGRWLALEDPLLLAVEAREDFLLRLSVRRADLAADASGACSMLRIEDGCGAVDYVPVRVHVRAGIEASRTGLWVGSVVVDAGRSASVLQNGLLGSYHVGRASVPAPAAGVEATFTRVDPGVDFQQGIRVGTIDDPVRSTVPAEQDILLLTATLVGEDAVRFSIRARGSIAASPAPPETLLYSVFVDTDLSASPTGAVPEDAELSWSVSAAGPANGDGVTDFGLEEDTIAFTVPLDSIRSTTPDRDDDEEADFNFWGVARLEPGVTQDQSRVGSARLPRPFPPEDAATFALDLPVAVGWEGTLTIEESGDYEFFVRSRGDVELQIDNVLVYDNAGSEREIAPTDQPSAVHTLDGGRHALRIEYVDTDGDMLLEIRWRRPGDLTSSPPLAPFPIPLAALLPPAETVGAAAAGSPEGSSRFDMRLIIHVDAGGQARLLKEAIILAEDSAEPPLDPNDPEEPARFRPVVFTDDSKIANWQADYNGVALRGGKPVGRRISAIGFDFAAWPPDPDRYEFPEGFLENPTAPWIGPGADALPDRESGTVPLFAPEGGVGFGDELHCDFVLPADHPTNPYKHRYHPDHDNKDARFASYVAEAFDIRRIITLRFQSDPVPPLPDTPDWGDTVVGGFYEEAIRGLHRQDLTVRGTFRLKLVTDVPRLNGGRED